jgi:adenylyltransferase/sulfurtransferase
MAEDRLVIGAREVDASAEDRFDRFRRIAWWDQDRLARAKVLVVGAGALGNEIVKDLALLGVGNLFVVDLDRVENSNLSRSVLFREADNGRPKAEVAVRAATDLYPALRARAFVGNAIYDLGLGVYWWADVVLGGLDNREARLAINRNCWKLNRPWIDGAIEELQGVARVFVPDGPCYECTMTRQDWDLLRKRRSCNLLSQTEMQGGRTPTTPTIGAMIAGLQCQEAVKLLHGLPTLAGHGWVFEGLSSEGYRVEYQRKPDCYSHDPLERVVELHGSVRRTTAGELLEVARELLGPEAELELARDMLEKLACPQCGEEEAVFASLGRVAAERAYCPRCPGVRRDVQTFYKIRGGEPFVGQPLAAIGVPPFDVLIARTLERAVGLLLADDAPEVLGPLAEV